MPQITAETLSIIVAFLRLVIEALTVDDGQQRVVVVLNPAAMTADELEHIVGISRWHRVIGAHDEAAGDRPITGGKG